MVNIFNVASIRDEPIWFDSSNALIKVNRAESLDSEMKTRATELITNGLTVIKGSLPLEVCDECILEFKDWKKRNLEVINNFRDDKGKLERIVNIHSQLKSFEKLFALNKSLPLQDFLFNGETTLYTSLFFEQGTTQPIHRDIPLFWTNPAYHYFGVWVALEDVDDNNGPLIVYEKGHLIDPIDRDQIGRKYFSDLNSIPSISEDLWKEYQSRVVRMCEEKGLVKKKIHVKKGDTIIWHPMLPHGGSDILDFQRTRLSFVMHTTPKNTPVFHANVFFNTSKKVNRKALWDYKSTLENRKIAVTGNMSIGHGNSYNFDSLK